MIASLVRTVNENISNVADSVHDTQHETAQGTTLTQQAGKALGSIFEGVEQQAQAIESITTMVTQQSTLSKEVLLILQDVSNETRKNSSSTRDASQTMWRLMQLVEQLRASVGAFKLREEQFSAANHIISQSTMSSQSVLPPTPKPITTSRPLHSPTSR